MAWSQKLQVREMELQDKMKYMELVTKEEEIIAQEIMIKEKVTAIKGKPKLDRKLDERR